MQQEKMDEAYELDAEESSCDDDDPCLLPVPRKANQQPQTVVFSPPEEKESARSVASSHESEVESHASDHDRIARFFGYNGRDATVPRAAYDALSHRIKTLEAALGKSNRELRSNTTKIAEQQSTIAQLGQQLQQKEGLLKQFSKRESAMRTKEHELEAREQSLEVLSRQLKKPTRNRRAQNVNPISEEVYDPADPAEAQAPQADISRRRLSRRDDEDLIDNTLRSFQQVAAPTVLPRINPTRNNTDEHGRATRSQTSMGFV